ncbi:MAG: AAA family ATPase [Bacteroidetes bacterium]|nr:AAA family ATPase [Bacteroidota bacterium]
MKIVPRNLQPVIEEWLFRGKVIIIYGARQVGKTTLVKELLFKHGDPKDYFNCEILSVMQVFQQNNPLLIKQVMGNSRLVVLDEAQYIQGIGQIIKTDTDIILR